MQLNETPYCLPKTPRTGIKLLHKKRRLRSKSITFKIILQDIRLRHWVRQQELDGLLQPPTTANNPKLYINLLWEPPPAHPEIETCLKKLKIN